MCYVSSYQDEFLEFESQNVPEIKRVPLDQCMLKLLALGVEDPVAFDYMDRPDSVAIRDSLHSLAQLGAIEKEGDGDGYALTNLGNDMSQFPMDPRLSKVRICLMYMTFLQKMKYKLHPISC